jgi:hypothetical protein
MPMGLMFWILMLLWFVFGLAVHFGAIGPPYGILGSSLLLFLLFLLLGWQVFGSPIK